MVLLPVIYHLGVLFFSLTGLEQQFLQELLTLRVPQQYRGRSELSGGPFLRPFSVPRDTQTQQKAAAKLPVPPLLQQRTLHQRLPSGELRMSQSVLLYISQVQIHTASGLK